MKTPMVPPVSGIFKSIIAAIPVFLLAANTFAQRTIEPLSDPTASKQLAQALKKSSEDNYKRALEKARKFNLPLSMRDEKTMQEAYLTGIDDNGFLQYTTTYNNIDASTTSGAIHLWPGGRSGLNLSGAYEPLRDRLGIWDGGALRTTHVELLGRIDYRGTGGFSDHGTHVAGTMISTGINPISKGMAYAFPRIIGYSFNEEQPSMAQESSNLLLSNHSYGVIAGWHRNTSQGNRWEFYGRPNENEDVNFGYYDSRSRTWDDIVFKAPFYLPVKSAGNNRSVNGPAIGGEFFRRNATGTWVAESRQAGISSNDSYDIISTYGNSKNILTVGAVNLISNGFNISNDVVLSDFTSFGPSDDGRIKPDLVGSGVSMISPISLTDRSYGSLSGTSMSAPNVTGTLSLLQELFHRRNNAFMRASTLKGIAIHTVDEAGPSLGPDYKFGWGLINGERAARVISQRGISTRIIEGSLATNQIDTFNIIASGNGGNIKVTLCWTDVPGEVNNPAVLNDPTLKLVNDLDVRLVRLSDNDTSRPWILSPENPDAPATRGDNFRDNVEVIETTHNTIPGSAYRVIVRHKKVLLVSSPQSYSLIISGIGGTTYGASAPSSNADSRIDNVTFGGINNTSNTGCATYSDFTTLAPAIVSPGQVVPLTVTLGTCGANNNKMAKVYIDFNNNGQFTEANELVATSPVINGTQSFSSNVTIPSSILPGSLLRMRIVAVETSNADDIQPVGSYTRGETEDYVVSVVRPLRDLAIVSLLRPDSTWCGGTAQRVIARIRNSGVNAIASGGNIAITAVIRQGTTTIATLTGTYNNTLAPNAEEDVILAGTFNTTPGVTYSISVSHSMSGDLVQTNNSIEFLRTASSTPTTPPTGTVLNCISTSNLNVQGSGQGTLFWYTSSSASQPSFTGNQGTFSVTSPAPSQLFIGLNDAVVRTGIRDKNLYPSGNYGQFTPDFTVQVINPFILEKARVYIGNSGRIRFEVLNENNQLVSTNIIDVEATSSTPGSGTTNNDPNDSGVEITLNLSFPAPGNYRIRLSYFNGATIFRNNNIPTSPPIYPIVVPGLLSITGSTVFGTATDPLSVYYYLYDWTVRPITGCPTVNRTAVTATTPQITRNGAILTSPFPANNQWYFNGNILSGATNNTFETQSDGVFWVVNTATNCGSAQSVITAIPVVNAATIGFTASPNPLRRGTTLRYQFTLREPDQVSLLLVDGQGKQVYQQSLGRVTGTTTGNITTAELGSGIYNLVLKGRRAQYIQRIIVQ